MKAKALNCLSVPGGYSVLEDFILSMKSKQSTILLDRAEMLFSEHRGDREYWLARYNSFLSLLHYLYYYPAIYKHNHVQYIGDQ